MTKIRDRRGNLTIAALQAGYQDAVAWQAEEGVTTQVTLSLAKHEPPVFLVSKRTGGSAGKAWICDSIQEARAVFADRSQRA